MVCMMNVAEELRAEHPCGALYAGLRQLSETETHTLTQFLHELRTPLYTFIAFKEGDILVRFLYNHVILNDFNVILIFLCKIKY